MDILFESRDTASDEDLYELLGCDENSSEEQIATEFRLLARKYHPDKVSSEEGRVSAEKMFAKLEKAKQILLDKEKRSKYDQWRTGGFKHIIAFEKWLDMQGRVHTSMHWAVPQKPIPSLPESSSNRAEQGTSEPHGQDAKGAPLVPASLEDFRKGGGRSELSKFRNYKI